MWFNRHIKWLDCLCRETMNNSLITILLILRIGKNQKCFDAVSMTVDATWHLRQKRIAVGLSNISYQGTDEYQIIRLRVRRIYKQIKLPHCNMRFSTSKGALRADQRYHQYVANFLIKLFPPSFHLTKMTYLLHQSETVFSRNPVVKPPLASQLLSLWIEATVALKAAVLIDAFRCPTSRGVGEKAHMKIKAVPPGRITLHNDNICLLTQEIP